MRVVPVEPAGAPVRALLQKPAAVPPEPVCGKLPHVPTVAGELLPALTAPLAQSPAVPPGHEDCGCPSGCVCPKFARDLDQTHPQAAPPPADFPPPLPLSLIR